MNALGRIFLFVVLALPSVSLSQSPKALFDNTLTETAGNADWIIDVQQPVPNPLQSTITPSTPETFWLGAISAWGVDLVKLGFTVHTLSAPYGITYGDGSNPYDLSNYQLYVVCEPQDQLTAAEKAAILSFVQNGGGLMMVADHYGSDRDSDGWDSPRIWNDLGSGTYFGIHFQVSGESNNNIVEASTNVNAALTDSIIRGAYGIVSSLDYHNGTTMNMLTANNPAAVGHIWMNGAPHGTTQVVAATSRYGRGKVAAVGDSSPADDGTGQSGNTLYNGWNDATKTNKQVFLNMCLWLAAASTPSAPAPVTLVSPPNAATNVPSPSVLRWNASPGATGYELDVSTSNTFASSFVADSTLTDTLRSVSGLALNTVYYWRARAKNGAGWGSYSVTRSLTSWDVPPAVTLSQPGDGSAELINPVSFSWRPASTADAYEIDIAASNSFTFILSRDSALTDTTTMIGGFAPDSTYYWRVRARNAAGWGAYGSTRSFSMLGLPPAVSAISPAAGATEVPVPVELVWGAVPGTDRYHVVLAQVNAFPGSAIIDDSTYTDTTVSAPNVFAGDVLIWIVRAHNAAGWGPYSALRSFTTGRPPSPAILIAPAESAAGVPIPAEFRWHPADLATSYLLQVTTDVPDSVTVFADSSIADTAAVVPSLAPGAAYRWTVRGRNLAGWGPPQERRLTTWQLPGQALLMSPADGASGLTSPVGLRWTAVAGAGSYQLQVSTDDGFAQIVTDDSSLADTSYSEPSADSLSIFRWRVRAKGLAGWGSFSAIRTFTLSHQQTVVAQFNNRWNIVSLPLRVADRRVASIFPAATSPAYAFENAYAQADSFAYGAGYWIKLSAAATDSLTGIERLSDTVAVHAGWNLVGSLSVPIPADPVTTIPAGILLSRFYGYDGTYIAADTLLPFRGYWVKCAQDGVLILK